MNFDLPFIPERPSSPREKGLTMVMDLGLSVRESEDLAASAGEFIDLVKFGFGTSLITKSLNKKIRIFSGAGLKPYFGGTLFEAFIVRPMFDDYRRFLDKFKIEIAEVSVGSLSIPQDLKLEFIRKLSEQVTVISEVGSKDAKVVIHDSVWVENIKAELSAGSWKVIAEARESGTVGIFNKDKSPNTGLIHSIIKNVNIEDVIWEAPVKSQQIWFVKLLGADVNLGNIEPGDVLVLETLRRGLRGDTFFQFLPDELKS